MSPSAPSTPHGRGSGSEPGTPAPSVAAGGSYTIDVCPLNSVKIDADNIFHRALGCRSWGQNLCH